MGVPITGLLEDIHLTIAYLDGARDRIWEKQVAGCNKNCCDLYIT